MSGKPPTSISQHFSDLPDPRPGINIQHSLVNIISIAICAVICGADTWVDVELFGKSKRKWLETFLDLPNGIPSHDTFGRVFRLLDPAQFQQRFYEWTQTICHLTKGEVLAVDGKQLRRSKDGGLGRAGIYMVNVWATENQLSLAQHKVDDHSNEITAIPILLELLDIEDCIITIDAIACQTEIVETIQAQNADYVIAAKGNQGTLFEDIQAAFESEQAQAKADYHKTINKGHGRIEIRECWVTSDEEVLGYIQDYKAWTGLQTLVKVVSERRLLVSGKIERETRYFIASLSANAQHLLSVVRTHWQVENSLHWVLDMAFREDDSRVRKDHGPQNFAVLRQLALNLLKRETSTKAGIKAKRKQAGWDENYLIKVLCAA